MIEIHIKVTGPGGLIGYETEVIRRSFELMGYQVEVKDAHPLEPGDFERMDARRGTGGFKILLSTEHIPWGG